MRMHALRLTPHSLAQLSGVSRTTIRRVLAGERRQLQHGSAEKLAQTLGVPLALISPLQRGPR